MLCNLLVNLLEFMITTFTVLQNTAVTRFFHFSPVATSTAAMVTLGFDFDRLLAAFSYDFLSLKQVSDAVPKASI